MNLVLATEFPPFTPGSFGGIGTVMFELAKTLAEEEPVTVLALAPEDGEAENFDRRQPFPIRRISRVGWRTFKTAKVAWAMRQVLRRQKIRDVYVPRAARARAPLLLRRRYGYRVITLGHGRDLEQPHPQEIAKVRWALQESDFVVLVSRFLGGLLPQYGLEATDPKVIITHPGIDLARAQAPGDVEALRRRLRLEGRFVLLTMSRIIRRKGQDVVIQALPRILAEVPHLVYVIAGEGELRPELEKTVRRLGLEEHVRFTGLVPYEATIPYYRLADLFIMVSRSIPDSGDVEGFGVVYLEANLCRVPVIGGNHGGCVEAVADGVSGVLVDPTDAGAVAAAVIRLARDADLRQKLGEAGYQRVREEFDWRVVVRRLKERMR